VVVKDILENEAYIGHAVRFKTGHLSYKNRLVINKPDDEWIRCENVFPPVVSPEMREAVRRLDSGHRRPADASKTRNLFSGLLRCADCGGTLMHKKSSYTSRVTGKKHTGHAYICGKHERSGGSVCSRHTMPESALLALVREDVKNRLDSVDVDEARIVREIRKWFNGASQDEAKKQCERLAARLSELASEGTRLYEDRLNSIISANSFKSLYEKKPRMNGRTLRLNMNSFRSF